jgi:CheY-like chemotaxis protein
MVQVLDKPLPCKVKPPQRDSILIIDDDEAMLEVLSRRLSQQGFDILTADSGNDGLQTARDQSPTLILLDLRLPDLDGFEICEALARAPETNKIPVIILSGMERPDIIRRSRAAGCLYFVHKPYDSNALLVLIHQAIDEAKGWELFSE